MTNHSGKIKLNIKPKEHLYKEKSIVSYKEKQHLNTHLIFIKGFLKFVHCDKVKLFYIL